MSRYIDADKIEYKHIVVFPEREDEHSVYKSEIDAMPTADAVEVKHGEWIWNKHNQRVCSNCQCPVGFIPQDDGWNEANYCPNCGARMDGEA